MSGGRKVPGLMSGEFSRGERPFTELLAPLSVVGPASITGKNVATKYHSRPEVSAMILF
jgi:hypothetical protein